ncbi:MAG: uracil-DNA glycosylase, family 4 [Eubacterium sp.]|jgi:DNA polymerase|nr:uracil-DNA glycosylase, family 4 [Eubacterium sp.]
MISNQVRLQLDELNEQYHSTFEKEEIVFGDGCITSPLVIVGEAPGKDEVAQGKPFVGSAGKNLQEFMNTIGLTRDAVYITNTIKYRLGRINEKTKRLINRPATKNDIINNQPWLHKEIILLCPKIIVTLGNVPLKAVTNDYNASIGEMHGILHTCRISEAEYKLFPLYHPASIIYNRALKEVYNQDMLRLKEIFAALETDNQTVTKIWNKLQ